MKKVCEKLAKLIDVKSIMTLSLTLCFCILCFYKVPTELKDIYLIIVGFYFGTQSQKNIKETNEKGE